MAYPGIKNSVHIGASITISVVVATMNVRNAIAKLFLSSRFI